MRLATIPRRFCKQSIQLITQSEEKDRFGKSKFDKQVNVLNHVLVQEETIYSGDGNSRQITANAVVFLFDTITEPMPSLDKQVIGNKINYHGLEWTITRLITNYYPTNPNKVYSYELEVI